MQPVDSTTDLLRLGERSGSELASALRELSARGPDATELASLATRLSLQGIAMTPPAPAAPAPGASLARRWKLALVGTALVSGVGFWLLLRARAAAPARDTAPTEVAVASTPHPGSGLRTGPNLIGHAALPGAVPPVTPVTPVTPGASSATATSTTSTSTSTSTPDARESAAARRMVAPEPSEITAPLLRNDALAKAKSSPTQRLAASATEAPDAAAALPTELELLRGARLALKGSPAEALRLVEQHRASYPSGKLTQERELIAISALVALGRRTAALSRATSFEQAFPSSPYRKQIGELLQ